MLKKLTVALLLGFFSSHSTQAGLFSSKKKIPHISNTEARAGEAIARGDGAKAASLRTKKKTLSGKHKILTGVALSMPFMAPLGVLLASASIGESLANNHPILVSVQIPVTLAAMAVALVAGPVAGGAAITLGVGKWLKGTTVDRLKNYIKSTRQAADPSTKKAALFVSTYAKGQKNYKEDGQTAFESWEEKNYLRRILLQFQIECIKDPKIYSAFRKNFSSIAKDFERLKLLAPPPGYQKTGLRGKFGKKESPEEIKQQTATLLQALETRLNEAIQEDDAAKVKYNKEKEEARKKREHEARERQKSREDKQKEEEKPKTRTQYNDDGNYYAPPPQAGKHRPALNLQPKKPYTVQLKEEYGGTGQIGTSYLAEIIDNPQHKNSFVYFHSDKINQSGGGKTGNKFVVWVTPKRNIDGYPIVSKVIQKK